MALREEDMLAGLEMGQVTRKPQLHLWGGGGESILGLRLYHEATPKEALLPPHSLLAAEELCSCSWLYGACGQ